MNGMPYVAEPHQPGLSLVRSCRAGLFSDCSRFALGVIMTKRLGHVIVHVLGC
jgi:hypothetical protein